ncbi:MAG: OmpH family outer membrane protein [Saprospiraceae bacterium]|nr:OmpH family outer membrane protein [Saprospiraceae bacterium]
MKVTMLLCSMLMCFYAQQVSAQKVGHVNSVLLIDSLKEANQASIALKQYEQSLAKTGEEMIASFQQKLKQYQEESKKGNFTINQQKQKESELEVDQNAIVNYRESMRSSLDKKRQELVKPILEKINNALKEIGKEEQYQFIFDSSVGMLFFRESDDLFSKVFKKLEPQN